MSQFGDGDCASVASTEWRTARKEHRCHACREKIRPGQKYHYTFVVFDGAPDVTKRCERCQAIFAHLNERICKEGDTEEFCDDSLNCGHTYQQRWDEPPPEWLAALALWRPGDPLPELPKKEA